MPTIRQLPPSVINKIAAGEVIERPASVVKELLENAVDAGATRIDVSLEQGGLELIRVADNGCGIESDQLHLAVASHATSKIKDADDLFRVQSLGFRGEALASIAEISHLRLRSRTAASPAGAELEVTGGVASEVAPCGCAVGTTIEIRKLFFNTPVRRKFMRSSQTEFGHSSEAFTRIALSYPSVHMTLRHQERVVYDLPPTEGWRDRIATFFGAELGNDLIWVENEDEIAKLCGYVAAPTQSRANNRLQYLFLNGRFIRDRSLQHALGEAYRGLLLTGRFPIAFLRLELRPDAVDVNVHPTKLEVRFEDSGRVYSQLLGTLRAKFLSTDLTARIATRPSGGESGADPEAVERHRREVADWARGGNSAAPASATQFGLQASVAEPRQPRFDFQPQPAWRPLPDFQPFSADSGMNSRAAPQFESIQPSAPTPVTQSVSASPTPSNAVSTRGMQVHNRYIVAETEEGMVVIDQHALHERILYEQLRERVLQGQMEKQRLLVPEPVRLTSAEAGAVNDAVDVLKQLGIEIEPFGGDTVVISSYPAMLANLSPQEILRQVVELLLSGGKTPDRRDVLDELLHMISCKAAIKAGDRLAVEEVDALLEQRHLFQDTHHCPHGRPTALVFTREELDRRFLRT
jgi:DNA mismatch repair protein MutL